MSLRDGESSSMATKSSIVTFKTDSKDVSDGTSVQVPQLNRTKQKSVIEKQVIILSFFFVTNKSECVTNKNMKDVLKKFHIFYLLTFLKPNKKLIH